jgi:hypothetical protein
MNSQVTIGQQSGGFAAGCQFRRSRAAEREIGHYTGFKVAILAPFLTDFWTLNSNGGVAGTVLSSHETVLYILKVNSTL